MEPGVQPAAGTRPEIVDTYSSWTTHRVGAASFRHPADWRVETSAFGLVLIPGDYRPDRELITITGTGAPGVRSPRDATVGQTLDTLMASSMPGLRRRGSPKTVDAGQDREGARYDYRGNAPDGRSAEASVYVAIEAGNLASIGMVADPSTLAMRRDTLEGIFRSFSSGIDGAGSVPGKVTTPQNTGPLDSRLIGMFGGESLYSGNGVHVNSQLVYALGADGVLHHGARSHINASQGDGAGGFRWTATGSSGGNVQRGTWSASGGIVTVQWDSGGSSSFAYGFEPDGTLALRHPTTHKLINIYSRIQ